MSAAEPPEETPPDETWAKAKGACFDLLAARSRSVDELRQALRRKGFDQELSERLLGRLVESGLVDDADFAWEWVRARHAQQGLGRKALAAELRNKGVDDDVAAEALRQVATEDEEEQARALVRKKLRTMGGVDERTATRRLLGLLGRKGYGQGLSYTVIREELAEAGHEAELLDDETS